MVIPEVTLRQNFTLFYYKIPNESLFVSWMKLNLKTLVLNTLRRGLKINLCSYKVNLKAL